MDVQPDLEVGDEIVYKARKPPAGDRDYLPATFNPPPLVVGRSRQVENPLSTHMAGRVIGRNLTAIIRGRKGRLGRKLSEDQLQDMVSQMLFANKYQQRPL